ncbi:hypothetical protein HMPREF0724_13183 [Prescottella equi ATCC 33707]|uniref:Uncharacterized protein n=1 Tax=Prescottella equi ATCC 33707 TaxID=525370 RepID=E9T3E2_RHOHA|nr:hypothetical protein HMPREF0724_13183 [Prescottella equi ATCC 33707]
MEPQPTTRETLGRTRVRTEKELLMGKRGRKKRSRKGNAANHGKRPNA